MIKIKSTLDMPGFYTEKRERSDTARHWAVNRRCFSWLKEYVGLHHVRITRGIPGTDLGDGITKEMVEKIQREEWHGRWGKPRPDCVKNNKIP